MHLLLLGALAMTVDFRTQPLAAPVLEPVRDARVVLRGAFAERMERNIRQWILTAPAANPKMLQMFRDRDRTPPHDLVPWAGEFAGKYLISAVQAWRLSRSEPLRKHIERFVQELIGTQREDGYLGPFPRAEQMMGPGRWDLWGQYHVMLGLYEWYRAAGDRNALAAALRCADLFCRQFLEGGKRVLQAGSEEMNQSSIHIFTLLYRETGAERYLRMARAIEQDWETPPSGDHVRAALAGRPFHAHPKPRWESLHGIQAIAELHWITGDERYRRAYETIWWSIVEGDRHNTGGFSSGEQATGNPYNQGAIETCCTIAWQAVTLDFLRMTGDSRAADELELATWNGVMGAQHPSGRWWTYNTPMDGEKKASAHDIVFQARAGSPELNCCSVNAPRGLGILADWAIMRAPGGIAINWYGPATYESQSPEGQAVKLRVDTAYPLDGTVRLRLDIPRPERFALWVRIPGWSRETAVECAGQRQPRPEAGRYLVLEREWRSGEQVRLDLDMRPWVWAGERECAGKVSLYRGPILLAYDPRFDSFDPTALPTLKAPLSVELARVAGPEPQPLLLARVKDSAGLVVTLCDFATAGASGNRYLSWLPAEGYTPAGWSKENPFRRVK